MAVNKATECPVCFEPYDDKLHTPRLLPCGHSFCTICLELMLNSGGFIICPLDKGNVRVPNGVSSLAKNFTLLAIISDSQVGDSQGGINKVETGETEACSDKCPILCESCAGEEHPVAFKCLDCHEHMCEEASKFHTRTKYTRDHKVVSIKDLNCAVHEGKALIYFNSDYNVLICHDCSLLPKYQGHRLELIQEAGENAKREIDSKLQIMLERGKGIKIMAEKFKQSSVKLDEAKDRERTKIVEEFREVGFNLKLNKCRFCSCSGCH